MVAAVHRDPVRRRVLEGADRHDRHPLLEPFRRLEALVGEIAVIEDVDADGAEDEGAGGRDDHRGPAEEVGKERQGGDEVVERDTDDVDPVRPEGRPGGRRFGGGRDAVHGGSCPSPRRNAARQASILPKVRSGVNRATRSTRAPRARHPGSDPEVSSPRWAGDGPNGRRLPMRDWPSKRPSNRAGPYDTKSDGPRMTS